jgi:hypothetical protein
MLNVLAPAGKSARRAFSALIAAAFPRNDPDAHPGARPLIRSIPNLLKLAAFADDAETDVLLHTSSLGWRATCYFREITIIFLLFISESAAHGSHNLAIFTLPTTE